MTALYWTLGLVALQRLVELVHARRNTVRLRRLGAVEADAGGYRLFVLLHAGWLASLAVFVPPKAPPNWPLIGVFALLQLGRIWVIVSLGRCARMPNGSGIVCSPRPVGRRACPGAGR